MKVDRRMLDSLYGVNEKFINESSQLESLEQMADTGALKGKIFKMKLMNP